MSINSKSMGKSYIFVSYAKSDIKRVLPIAEAVKRELEARALPVDLWMDVSHLHPGEQWDTAISEALDSSIGFLLFISSGWLSSEWSQQEIMRTTVARGHLIIPVVLDEGLQLPPALALQQGIVITGQPTSTEISRAASKIAKATESYLWKTPGPPAAVSVAAPTLATNIAQEIRAAEPAQVAPKHDSVFVVHGHATQSLAELENYLASVAIKAVVLSRQNESPQSLFQKFMSVAAQARFAIVMLSADDYGASRRQYDAVGVGNLALQFRPRQNVILELGFFYGRLGWENVFVVQQDPDKVYPNFELPSDLNGVVFDSMSDANWQKKLGARLSAAGFVLSPPA